MLFAGWPDLNLTEQMILTHLYKLTPLNLQQEVKVTEGEILKKANFPPAL